MEVAKKRKSYCASEKLEIVAFAEKHGNRNAARKFDVCESNVRDWRKKKCALLAMSPSKRARRGRVSQTIKLNQSDHVSVIDVESYPNTINANEERNTKNAHIDHEVDTTKQSNCVLCTIKDEEITALKNEVMLLKSRIKQLESEDFALNNEDVITASPKRYADDAFSVRESILSDDEEFIFKHRL